MNKKSRSDAKLTKQLRIVLNSDFDKREGKVQSKMNELKAEWYRGILKRKFYRYYTDTFCDFLLNKLKNVPDKRRMHFTILEYRSLSLDKKLLTIGLYDSKYTVPLFYDDVSFKEFARGFPYEEYFMKLFPINNIEDFINIILRRPPFFGDCTFCFFKDLKSAIFKDPLLIAEETYLLLNGLFICECCSTYSENYIAEPSHYLSITSLF